MDSNKPKNSADKRSAPLSWRPPAGGEEKVRAKAKASGKSLNAYFNQQMLGEDSGKPIMDKKSLALLLSQAARINGHLEEMGHSSSDSQNFLILEECRHELSEIRAALLAGMRGNKL